MGDSFSVMQTP